MKLKKPVTGKQRSTEITNNLFIKKVKIKNEIDCTHCKEDSGFTNDDIRQIKIGDDDIHLPCQNCGSDAIVLKSKSQINI